LRSKARLDIAQALAIRHLREGHHSKLFAASKTADPDIPTVARDNPLKTRPWHEIHDLRKQRPAKVHGIDPRSGKIGKTTPKSPSHVQIDTKQNRHQHIASKSQFSLGCSLNRTAMPESRFLGT
jgi:hypothetical protein